MNGSPTRSMVNDADRRPPEDRLSSWLADRIAGARTATLSPAVEAAAVERIVDSLAAFFSGSQLPAGQAARAWVLELGGAPQATLVGSDQAIPAVHAALANAMMAHADETDNVDLRTKAHPGSSVVIGYDVCVRLLAALDPEGLARAGRSLQGIGSTFGATAAAVLLTPSGERQICHALSYAAQQASGIATWPRDPDHVEKAFDLAGMGARNGVTAATMIASGQTGVELVFDGDPAGLQFFASGADAARATEAGGDWLVATAIKPYPVGYPIQAAVEALLTIWPSVR